MSDALSALFQKIIDVINVLKVPIFITLSILGLLDLYHANPFNISTLLNKYSDLPPILFTIWLFAGATCLIGIVSWLRKIITSSMEKHTNLRQNHEQLYHLTQEQQAVLLKLIQANQSWHYFERTEMIEELERRDIVTITGTPHPDYDGRLVPTWAPYLCILQPWVRNYLEKHLELLQEWQKRQAMQTGESQ